MTQRKCSACLQLDDVEQLTAVLPLDRPGTVHFVHRGTRAPVPGLATPCFRLGTRGAHIDAIAPAVSVVAPAHRAA